MRYAIITNGTVSNIILAADGFVPTGAEAIVVQEDVGIGDFYANGVFTRPEPPEPTPPTPDPIAHLQEDNKLLKAQLAAAIQSNQTLEDCLVEMASVVYA